MRRISDHSDAAGVLASGGVLLLATDTLPGFHARVDRPAAVDRIQLLKGRRRPKPLVVLAVSAAEALRVAGPLDRRQLAYVERCWPGPFSLVLPVRAEVPDAVTAGGPTVAVRVPGDEALREFLAAAGGPLASTSVNAAGQAPARTLDEAVARFGDAVDGVWDPGGSPPEPGRPALPSAVIDLTTWPPRQIRPGPLTPPPVDDLDADWDEV
ncbi:MAG: L-threonylcarbamoyladenylate synthase [bacterium]|nr:L-threonylcarbamoyladenylate synthase [bacterium]